MATKEILPIAFPYASEFVGMAPDGITPIYDRAVGSEAYRETWNSFFTQGVFDSVTHFRVSPVGGLYLEVSAGSAFVDGVTMISKNVVTLLAENPSMTEDRIDRVVIQNNYIDRYTYIYIKNGDTTLIRTDEIYEIGIADILIRRNITSLTEEDITDLRANPEYCGSVTLKPAEDWVSWAALFESFKAKLAGDFSAWFATIKDILDENIAAHLLGMIEELDSNMRTMQVKGVSTFQNEIINGNTLF